jgi:hypothetical protein
MVLMTHSLAYFIYDTLIEIYYGTADTITNAHHFIVLAGTVMHVRSKYNGFEFILCHLIAESSNPFIIIRTLLKLSGDTSSKLYSFNEYLFATVFIVARMIITPILLIVMYEAPHVIYTSKLSVSAV